MSFFCPKCQGDSEVVDSRVSGNTTRRRRVCLQCKERWTTYEMESDELLRLRSFKRRVAEAWGNLNDVMTEAER